MKRKWNLKRFSEIEAPKDRAEMLTWNCSSCYFGNWSPDNRSRSETGYCYHCTIRPPLYPSGHPTVCHYAVCAYFTEREKPHAQPLRHLSADDGSTVGTDIVKG